MTSACRVARATRGNTSLTVRAKAVMSFVAALYNRYEDVLSERERCTACTLRIRSDILAPPCAHAHAGYMVNTGGPACGTDVRHARGEAPRSSTLLRVLAGSVDAADSWRLCQYAAETPVAPLPAAPDRFPSCLHRPRPACRRRRSRRERLHTAHSAAITPPPPSPPSSPPPLLAAQISCPAVSRWCVRQPRALG